LQTGIALGSPVQHQTFANSTAYRYYKLIQTAGTTSESPYLMETEFRIG
jgi:hypothetical protein